MFAMNRAARSAIANTLLLTDQEALGLSPVALPEMFVCGIPNANLILRQLEARGFVIFQTSDRRRDREEAFQ
jgi:hypothetical protein